MGHFLLEIALSICFGIVGNLYQKIKHVSLGIRVNEDTIDMAALDMILHAPPYRMAFATVQVELHELRMEKGTLGIQIFAEFQHNDIAGVTSFKDNTIESVIDKYEATQTTCNREY